MESEHPTARRFDLRLWQNEALEAWRRVGFRGVAEVATGGGKTKFALACIEEVGDLVELVHIVVPSLPLADQWNVALQAELGVNRSDIANLRSTAERSDCRRFNISVINSARKIDPEIWTNRARMLIVDECHRAGSLVNGDALRGGTFAALGLSATPNRQYDDNFRQIVEPVLGQIFYSYTVEQATRDGILTPFRLTNVRITLSESEQSEYDALTARIRRAPRSALDQDERLTQLLIRRAKVSNNALIRLPVAVKLVEAHRGARTIVFHESIEASESILAILVQRRHSATLYHSGMSSAMRRENLRLFRKGIYDVLVTCRALDEGVDIPELSIGVIAAATATDRQRVQRLGRVLRPAEGKEIADIYTIYATDPEEARLKEEEGRLEDVSEVRWMRVGDLS